MDPFGGRVNRSVDADGLARDHHGKMASGSSRYERPLDRPTPWAARLETAGSLVGIVTLALLLLVDLALEPSTVGAAGGAVLVALFVIATRRHQATTLAAGLAVGVSLLISAAEWATTPPVGSPGLAEAMALDPARRAGGRPQHATVGRHCGHTVGGLDHGVERRCQRRRLRPRVHPAVLDSVGRIDRRRPLPTNPSRSPHPRNRRRPQRRTARDRPRTPRHRRPPRDGNDRPSPGSPVRDRHRSPASPRADGRHRTGRKRSHERHTTRRPRSPPDHSRAAIHQLRHRTRTTRRPRPHDRPDPLGRTPLHHPSPSRRRSCASPEKHWRTSAATHQRRRPPTST